jgi:hypothetical protein
MALAITGAGGNSGIVQRVGAGVALDPDAAAYIAAVEAADGQMLEPALVTAYNEFVLGCKADASPFPGVSNFDAIKASCIMAGARTLAGALVPLRGPAPTNFNFVAGDYDRVLGLLGNGINKYLDSNRSASADSPSNAHVSTFLSSGLLGLGSSAQITALVHANPLEGRLLNSSYTLFTGVNASPPSFAGFNRVSLATLTGYSGGQFSDMAAPGVAASGEMFLFRFIGTFFDSRVAYYSIGEAVDLAALDARVTTLQAAIAAALA